MKLEARDPFKILDDFKKEFHCLKVSELRRYFNGAKQKQEREIFYTSLFAAILNKVGRQKYFVINCESDDYRDGEIINIDQYRINQKLPENQRKCDHFLIQNVSITSQAVEKIVNSGENNIYGILKKHLLRAKLSPKAGDYKSCILIFYLSLKINGLISLEELRSKIRRINQTNFQQIWIIAPYHNKYSIAELLCSDDQSVVVDFLND